MVVGGGLGVDVGGGLVVGVRLAVGGGLAGGLGVGDAAVGEAVTVGRPAQAAASTRHSAEIEMRTRDTR